MSTEFSGRVISTDDVTRRIHEFVLTTLLHGEEAANLTDSTPLLTSGVLDSLSTLEVGAFIEEAFDITIAPEELTNPEHMETIAGITPLVVAKLAVGVGRS